MNGYISDSIVDYDKYELNYIVVDNITQYLRISYGTEILWELKYENI